MKAREVRERLQGKVEPELIICMCGIAESLSAQQEEIKTLAQLLDSITDILMQLGATTEGLANAVKEIQKIREN